MASPGNQHCVNGTLSFPMFTKPKPRAENNNTVNVCFTNGLYLLTYVLVSLQCFDTMVGRQEEHLACENWVMRCWRGYLPEARCRLFTYMTQLMSLPSPLSLALFTSRLVLPFWLTEVVLEKRSLNGRSSSSTLCPKKVSSLNILQQPPQTCTDLNEILHTQDDIYFCHRRQIS